MRQAARVLLGLGLVLAASRVDAALKHRVPSFEPTDLDLEAPRTLELSLQFGAVFRSEEPRTRLFVPDFELDLGITDRVEIGIDGAISLDREGHRYHLPADTLWTSVKLGFLSAKDADDPTRVWSLGAQLGPRLPTAPNSVGTGYGLVLLGARMDAPWHLFANLGAVLEPIDRTAEERSAGVLYGIDMDLDLDRVERFSLLAELAGAYSLGPDPHDFHATLGLELATLSWLNLSLSGFYGFLPGGDRGGLFLGICPKFRTGI